MKKNPLAIAIGALLLILFGLLLFVFQVRTTEVAVVTFFGRPSRDITEPGPYFKWPWPIESVHTFDQRVQNFESVYEQTLTADSFNLNISVYVGWHISGPKVFFPKFGSGSITEAERALEAMVRSAQNSVVGQHPFSHFISTDPKELKFAEVESQMLHIIQDQCRTNNYGIDVNFLGIKRLGLPESVTQLVFDTMRAERERLVKQIESEGRRQATSIRSSADKDSANILAEADAKATSIRSQGEAEAFKYFQVFEQNPELANLLLSLSGLESVLREKSTLIVDPRTPPFDLLQAQPASAAAKK